MVREEGWGTSPSKASGAGGGRWGEDGILKAQDPGARADLQATYTAGRGAGVEGGPFLLCRKHQCSPGFWQRNRWL